MRINCFNKFLNILCHLLNEEEHKIGLKIHCHGKLPSGIAT